MSEHAIEERVRAALHRRAADIDVEPPPWEDVVGRAGGVVIPLRPTDTGPAPAHLRPARRRRLPRVSPRPALATAAALLLVLGAAVVVDGRLGPGPDGEEDGGETAANDTADDVETRLEVPDTPTIPSPGGADFAPLLATAMPVDTASIHEVDATTDPRVLAEVYLREVGLAGGSLVDSGYLLQVDPFKTDPPDQVDPQEGTVWWSVQDEYGTRLTDGGVFLRRAFASTALPRWEIVGAYTAGSIMSLSGVRRGDGVLAFTVGDYFVEPVTRVLVNGVEAHDDPLPAGTKSFTLADPAPDQVVTVQVQHLDAGIPVSITAMAIAPEEPGRDFTIDGDPTTSVTAPPATQP